MAARIEKLTSDIAWSTHDRIMVKGQDLCGDILGKQSLGDVAFLIMTDRLPSENESIMFNALAVTLIEHGMTPSAIATRMTVIGAPEAMQAAVAAGLAGLGSVFVGSMETAAHLLQDAIPDPGAPVDIDVVAGEVVADLRSRKAQVPGIGHPIHKPVDPRAVRLFEIAEQTGFSGPYVALMKRIAGIAGERAGKELPINATGAIAAIASEMGISWSVIRGIGVISRCIGLVGHVREELTNPIAREITARVSRETSADAIRASEQSA
ncbi:MAG TPA: citryl-CoA lyase [Blastococcus sp.]|jgi:citrate synthase|nr:citryl-CoA lyase [Blastococcus sp.]